MVGVVGVVGYKVMRYIRGAEGKSIDVVNRYIIGIVRRGI
jgi:hypothetical protein